MIEYLSYVLDTPLSLCEFPVEYRKYPSGAGGMIWHRDLELVGRQYEFVYTVQNTSDSRTLYKDFFGKVHSVWTEPNSLIILRASGVLHSVTPVTTGERTIVKFALKQTN